ncbi:MAG: PDZ domain-containing protein [bacterium]
MRINKKQFWSTLGAVLVLAVITGGLAGVIASVLTNQSLDRYVQSLSGDDLTLISQVKPRPLPGTYEEALSRVQESGWPAFATITSSSVDSQSSASWIQEIDSVGHGAVITSDGWILAHSDSLSRFYTPTTQAEVWVDGERFEIQNIVYDTLTDAALIKVDAQNLPVLAFGATQNMSGGEFVFGITSTHSLVASSLEDPDRHVDSLILRAEEFDTYWRLTDNVETGTPLLNSLGELVGFMSSDHKAIPLHHALGFIQSVLRSGEVERAALGAYVVDVDTVLNVDAGLGVGVDAGALIVAPNSWTSAVDASGPADLAGLLAGDLIVSIDETNIMNGTSLSEALGSYSPGSTARIIIIRTGEIIEVEVTFANLSDLVY